MSNTVLYVTYYCAVSFAKGLNKGKQKNYLLKYDCVNRVDCAIRTQTIGLLKQNVYALMPSGTHKARVLSRQVQMTQKFFQRLMTQYLILIVHIWKKIKNWNTFFMGINRLSSFFKYNISAGNWLTDSLIWISNCLPAIVNPARQLLFAWETYLLAFFLTTILCYSRKKNTSVLHAV